jgi:hypothetical protein
MPPAPTPPYSLAADLLNKFDTSPDWIQALWLIAVPALIFGLGWLVKEMVVALAGPRICGEPGELVCRVYRRMDGRWVVCWDRREVVLRNRPACDDTLPR